MDIQIDFQNIISKIEPWFFDHGFKIVAILIGAAILSRVVKLFIDKAIRSLIKPDQVAKDPEAEKKREDTLIRIFNSTLSVVIWVMAALMIVSEFGVNIGPLIAGAGVMGIAIGFGAQYIIRDFLAGLFIMLENQYRVGDVIKIAGVSGSVEDITLRKTILRDIEGQVHHIPNGEIKVASNMTQTFSRVHIKIGVAYKEDIDKVTVVINKVGQELSEDKEWKEAIFSAPTVMGIDEFADSAVIVKILGETMPLKQWGVARELRRRIKIAFDKENIEIPFPQVDVWQRKEEK